MPPVGTRGKVPGQEVRCEPPETKSIVSDLGARERVIRMSSK